MSPNQKLQALLIDDEVHCIETLRYELQLNCPQVQIAGTASSGPEGIKAIHELKPDLVFLDIEMPGMSGFEMLRQIGNMDFAVIFVTAYDQYALQAFRCAATDYLLKPVISDQLKDAVNRVTSQKNEPQEATKKLEALLYNLREGLKSPRIALPTGKGIDFVDANDILYCNAESNYTHIVLNGNKKYTLSKTLKDVEEMLEHLDFFRIHQSHLINFKHLQRYIREDGGYVVMEDGVQIPISKRRKDDFLTKLKMA